jgi:ABC-2 type transport system ATP-binding protein
VIKVNNLKKQFGNVPAVRDISFEVRPGEVLGFLGPNGAGKSTTMKMLTGFIRPTSGEIEVCGYDVLREPKKAQQSIGYLPEGAPCYEEMTPRDFLRFIAEIRGFRGAGLRYCVDEVISKLSLREVLDQRIETLSKGFKRRVGLAQAILHDPDVLILDEPTDGLDPNQKHHVREMISGLSETKIVIISTHILEEVSAVCSRAIIIAGGNVVLDGTPESLESRSRNYQSVVIVSQTSQQAELGSKLAALTEVEAVETDSHDRLVVFPAQRDNQLLAAINRFLQSGSWEIEMIYQQQGQLDEVFRAVTGGDSHE